MYCHRNLFPVTGASPLEFFPLILGTTWQIFRPFFRLIHRTTIKGNILIPKMLQETWQ